MRAVLAAVLVGLAGAVVAGIAYQLGTPFGRALLGSVWSIPVVAVALAALALVPSLWYLLRVFKTR